MFETRGSCWRDRQSLGDSSARLPASPSYPARHVTRTRLHLLQVALVVDDRARQRLQPHVRIVGVASAVGETADFFSANKNLVEVAQPLHVVGSTTPARTKQLDTWG